MRIIKFFRSGLLAFMLVLSFLAAMAQKVTISGVVTDNENRPIPGVTVNVKGTNINAQTSNEGKYSIAVPDQNSFLTFRYVGYISRELAMPKGTTLNVKLQENVIQTEDVVVIGYGTAKKKDLTGSVGRVNMNDVMKAPVGSFDQALAGRVAGVQVTTTDGQPGNSINIVVRGANSVTQSNSPLYVIDGFPVEDNPINTNVTTAPPANTNTFTNSNNILASLNPADIESIEVLKDASATAIYGARGSNGVVMITTKRGKSGPPVVNYNVFYGNNKSTSRVKVMAPYDFLVYKLELDTTTTPYVIGSGAKPSTYQYWLSGGTTLDYYKALAQDKTPLEDAVFRGAPSMNHTLSVSGGSDKTRYSISGNYFNQDGIIVSTGYKRYQGRFSLDQTISEKLKVGINTNFSFQNQIGTMVGGGSAFNPQLSLMNSLWSYMPMQPSRESLLAIGVTPLDYEDDDDAQPYQDKNNDYRFNPLKTLENTYNNTTNKELNSNGYLEYKFVPNLVLRVSGGIIDRTGQNDQFYNSHTWQGSNPKFNGKPNGLINTNKFTSLLNENILTYTKNFNETHDLTAMVGFTDQEVKVSSNGFSATNVPNEELGINALSQGTPNTVTTSASSNTSVSVLGRVNYGYKSRYLFTVSYRADASSKFGSQNRWAYFPSGAFAWRISKEKFMDGLSKIVSNAKLKVTYGQTGNNRLTDFPYLSSYAQLPGSGYVFNNVITNGAVVSSLSNPDLKWETTAQSDLGLELGFFKDRISIEADVYNKVTSDLIMLASAPTSTGYASFYRNVGKVQNRGLEFTLNTVNIETKDFSWTSNFNISFNRNKALQLADNQETLVSSLAILTNSPYITKVGQPLGLMFGLVADGLYQVADFNKGSAGNYILKDNVPGNGNTRGNILPGDIKYKDLNGDGTINASDFTVIGNSLPKHIGGFNNNFRYKGFDLNVFFQWSYGNDIMNYNRYQFMGGSQNNQFAEYVNRWTPNNTNTNIVRAGGFGGSFGGSASTYFIEDGSFLRLKTVSFGYNLPASVLKRLNLKSVRVSSSFQNLWLWTNYSGQDPEVSTYNSALTGGFDYSSYPKARTMTLGLNVTF